MVGKKERSAHIHQSIFQVRTTKNSLTLPVIPTTTFRRRCHTKGRTTSRHILFPKHETYTLTDDYESATDEGDAHSPSETSPTTDDPSKKGRRNSIVVIPPMQICPGDLLVYSKVLSQRNTLLDYDGSTQSLSISEDTSRKGKNTWSLLRLFDRSGRSKSESLCGLEEVLSNLQPSEFIDEHLSKYKGMQWAEFVSLWEGRTPKECKGLFRRHSKKQLSSQSGSHQSTLTRTFSRILTPASAEKDSNQENLVTSFTKAQTENKSEAQPMSPVHSNHVGEDGVKDSNDNSIAALDEIEHQIENLGTLTRSRNELKRREAMWDLFQSECMFLDDHLMVLRNVFMEPLKKIQVEGFAMFAEPEVLFGNLEELCCVGCSIVFKGYIIQQKSFVC
ncbi:pleckstriny domain-containing family G member 7-like protein [Trichonephila clavata]|uniref:Pleckstriny domain-containing family G member 7-like protein n=1 Tax=Trichonephila clavata TaxID=2740835 RepID=A0A8X6FI64_TRICU|nr:pleckstriny domain-containing family G member 7-like protein [Trichonephila clavata]